MPRALSMDIRERMAASVDAGLSCNATAKRFSVAVSTVIKLMQGRKARGTLSPKQMGGYRTAILAPHEETLKSLVAATPDATLAELGDALRKKKIKVSRSALAAYLTRLRLTFKKNPARLRARPR
jgi:transposase